MFDKIKVIFHRSREILTEGNLRAEIQKQIFWNKIATPVEMDLCTLPPNINIYQDTEYKYVELKLADLQTEKWVVPLSSRRMKAFQYLKKGWRNFAIVKDSTVVGDVWCVTFPPGLAYHMHPDLKMLGIQYKEGEAYGFDMLIDPAYRGKNLAVPLHRHLQVSLKNEGFTKVYGYYWNDNLPALWMHRMIKFHELPKRRVSRFFSIIYARFLNQTGPSIQASQKSASRNSSEDKS